jgi:hypothetical protein
MEREVGMATLALARELSSLKEAHLHDLAYICTKTIQ